MKKRFTEASHWRSLFKGHLDKDYFASRRHIGRESCCCHCWELSTPHELRLFTRTFLKHVARKGVTVDRIMRDVRTEVNAIAKTVGHDQVPALYDQVVGDFYFSQ